MIRATFRTRASRTLCFDLENKPGAYWYDGNPTSLITAFGWKWEHEDEVHTLLLRANGRFMRDNGRTIGGNAAFLVFAEEMGRADVVYGHNIRRHDLPMLNAGLFRRQMPPLPELRTTDTCRDLPKTAGVSKSLENMAAMYGLEGEKFAMSQPMWEEANSLTTDGVALARRRVASDVVLQERLRQRLIELDILKPPRRWTP